jgi:exonuclease III
MKRVQEISFLLLNVSSLNKHQIELFELIEEANPSVVVLTGTHHDEKAVNRFSRHFSNFNVITAKVTNAFGGVLVVIHRSILVSQISGYENEANLVALEVGRQDEKFQLIACYSPPTEPLPLHSLETILQRNRNTIIMGDINAKHTTWSRSQENLKGRALHT